MAHLLAAVASGVLLTAVATVPAAVDDPAAAPPAAVTPERQLEVGARSGRDRTTFIVDPATGAVAAGRTSDSAPIVIPLPDSALSAELRRPTWNPRRELYVVERDADGAEIRRTKICGLDEDPRHVAWQPRWQRLIYVRGVGAEGRLRAHDPRTGEETDLPVRGAIELVRVSDDGQIGVLERAEGDGKERRANLVVFRGRAMGRAIVSDMPISTFAWSPENTSLIYSVPGELRRHNFLGDGTHDVLTLGDLDPALRNHLAHSMDIAPDGTIALVLRFAGGRATVIGEEPEPLPGDREVYLLNWPQSGEPGDATFRAIAVDLEPTSVRWVGSLKGS